MEHKKKKNDADRSDRNIFIGIGIMCLIGLFVLMCLYNALTMCTYGIDFDQTVTAIVSTNDDVATQVLQTYTAEAAQFAVTGTPLP